MIPKWEDRVVIKTIEEKDYIIEFVKHDNLETNLEGMYRLFAELIYENSLEKAN